jgi:hypothetical protein
VIAAVYARRSAEQNGVADNARSVTRRVEHVAVYATRKRPERARPGSDTGAKSPGVLPGNGGEPGKLLGLRGQVVEAAHLVPEAPAPHRCRTSRRQADRLPAIPTGERVTFKKAPKAKTSAEQLPLSPEWVRGVSRPTGFW